MSRLNLALLVGLLASCIYLIQVSYDSRRLFTALDRARSEQRVLETERERLKTALRTEATPSRVERMARDRLAMRTATPAVTFYVASGPAATRPPSVAPTGAVPR
jgi:cell division protein FtsL